MVPAGVNGQSARWARASAARMVLANCSRTPASSSPKNASSIDRASAGEELDPLRLGADDRAAPVTLVAEATRLGAVDRQHAAHA